MRPIFFIPVFARTNKRYGLKSDAESGRQNATIFCAGANFGNFFPIKFCVKVFLSRYFNCLNFLTFSFSALSNHVIHVVLVRSKKQMVRINALSIVAFMTNKKLVWNFSLKNKIRNSVGYLSHVVYANATIAMHVYKTSPMPTARWLKRNLIEKPFFGQFGYFLSFGDSAGTFILHNVVSLLALCHALGCFIQRKGISIFTQSPIMASA